MPLLPVSVRTSVLGLILIAFMVGGLAMVSGPALAQPRADMGERQGLNVSLPAPATGIAVPVQTHPWVDADSSAFCDDPLSGFDRRGLQRFYCTETPVVTKPLTVAHRSAYPVFYTAVPAAWLGAWAVRGTNDFSDAYRLTLTQGATYLTVIGLKRLFQRPRPFMSLPDLTSRSGNYGRHISDGQFASLPSGHAGLSVALATSWSLSHPRWYVIAPAALWSGAVSLSRLHLGVHYPSDIVLGAVLGAGIATGIHLLRNAITPAGLQPDEAGVSTNDIGPAAAMATGPMVVLFRTRF